MSIEQLAPSGSAGNPSFKGPGPYLAKVVSVLDPNYMGVLTVRLLRGTTPQSEVTGVDIPARYLSPFYGVTSSQFEGNNPKDFNDVQKSYGFWMVPPDVGVTVMVIFVQGDANQCYWIGCVPDQYQNHMVPGLAATNITGISQQQLDKYNTDVLPVAEFNKSTQDLKNLDVNKIKKPVHPFADVLVKQGLLLDTTRGVTSSGARRQIPNDKFYANHTFGISTPGPIDPTGPTGMIGSDKSKKIPVSRLGGSTFVMDDGDESGNNELVRIRTRTGHQILMHNTQDLIYIANSVGTAWIELTSNGKIDIYAADSVSIHTENDFNFRAERDINLEAGRNINIAAGGDWHTDVTDNFIVNAGRNGTLTFGGNTDIHSAGTLIMDSSSPVHLSGTSLYMTSENDLNLVAGTTMYQTASTDINVLATQNIIQNAVIISVNSAPGTEGTKASTAAIASGIPTQELPGTSVDYPWINNNLYKGKNIDSIMNRVPMHEPWSQHENINPSQFSPSATDVTNRSGFGTTSRPGVTSSVDYSKAPNVQGDPPTPTGNTKLDNMAAFLWMIRVCEGTSSADGYKVMFTGKLFDVNSPTLSNGSNNPSYNYADHPNIANKGGGITSTAAGAYQFLYSTWKECQKALSLPDFSPLSQDKACIYLLKRRRAIDDIETGNFTSAINKCNREWASLPGSPYDQHPKDIGTALALYKQGGGTAVA